MPFRKDFEPVLEAIRAAVEELADKKTYRADDYFQPGTILDNVKDHIHKADLCVVDLTDNNPNVLWELGYAHALGKMTIPISQTVSSLPIDMAGQITISYSVDELGAFKARLKQAVKRVVREFLIGKPRVPGPPYSELVDLAEKLMSHRLSGVGASAQTIFSVVMRALEIEHPRVWKNRDMQILMTAIESVCGRSKADKSFWPMICCGLLAYHSRDEDEYREDTWRDNKDLVEISDRGCALLNRIKEPL